MTADLARDCAEFLANPRKRAGTKELFQRLHAEDSLVRVDERLYVAASYDLATVILASPDFGVESAPDMPQVRLAQSKLLDPYLRRMMAVRDPPAHARLRRLVGRAFNPAMAISMRATVERQVDAILDRFREEGRIDIVRDLAKPLPPLVSAEMFGIPESDRAQLVTWIDLLSGQIARFGQEPEHIAVVDEGFTLFCDYVEEMCAITRRASHPNELMATLIAGRDEGELDADELVAFIILLLISGYDTATNMIANAVLALVRHSDVMSALRADPGLVPAALRESMRMEPSVRMAARTAHDDVTLGNTVVARGSVVLVLLAAANRDPRHFEDPDTFDLARGPKRHLAFGHGIHYCLGAALGTVEGEVVLDRVARTMSNVALSVPETELVWREELAFNGVVSLPIRFDSV